MPNEIAALDAKKLLDEKKAVLLDVREKEELEFASLKEDYWIPIRELLERSKELPKNRKIIVVCRTGSRSGGAAEYLVQQGFDAVNLRGGIFEWHDKVDKKIPKYCYMYTEKGLEVRGI